MYDKQNAKTIISDICSVMEISGDIKEDDNLLELGLSSIQIMKLVSKWRANGRKCSFAKLISNPTVREWERLLSEQSEKELTSLNKNLKKEISMFTPFSLTDVQYAYWIGRTEGQYLGNVGCHGYMEVIAHGIDPVKLNTAFYKLQVYHPMLRAKISKDGMQQVMSKPYKKDIVVYDFRGKDAQEHLKYMREVYSHRLLDIYSGQVSELQLTLLSEKEAIMHFDIDLLIADVTSFQIILQDLASIYNGVQLDVETRNFNFAEYIYEENKANFQKKKTDCIYWNNKIKDFPGKPELPVKNVELENVLFSRRKNFLNPDEWEVLKQRCRKYQVTPAVVLLTLYGKVIAKFSENKKFLMNIPLFNRLFESKKIEHAVADFTNLLIMEMDFSDKRSFLDEVQLVWREFSEGMEHISYSGVQVQRDYIRMHPEERIAAPIVFSCNLGVPLINKEFRDTFGDISYMISQTPQVWLDFQVFDMNDGLLMIWDGVDDLFPNGLLDEMFFCYKKILYQIINQREWESIIPIDIKEQIKSRKLLEVSSNIEHDTTIHKAFFDYADKFPNAIALVDNDSSETKITYGELREKALKIAYLLKKNGMKTGDKVGILLARGKAQIFSALGILAAGGTYISISIHQPFSRVKAICELSEMKFIIVDNEEKNLTFPEQISVLTIQESEKTEMLHEIEKVDPQSLAYIIFTSGSTGTPKGVMIKHSAAWNTICDINKKFMISCTDTVLAVSAMEFDLSVYDIFGLLSVGGKIVLISQEGQRNAEEMFDKVVRHGVSIWNSVPALLDLFLIVAEEKNMTNYQLRVALVSGDWIPLTLPERLKKYAPDSTFISLGGATEGSIWSNYFPVKLPIPKDWTSIPYGMPLTNQKYRVVDARGEDCPNWVSGELWIGGMGVAEGYIGNNEETQKHFVSYHGERWYRTGDCGRFWPDGILEFLGRKDQQIKIRGHRIELEEIEKQYIKNEKISNAIVIPISKKKNPEGLAAFLVPALRKYGADDFVDGSTFINLWKTYVDKTNGVKEEVNSKELRQLVVESILKILLDLGFPTTKDATIDLQDYVRKGIIDKKYRFLISQWLEILCESSVVEQISEKSYQNLCDWTELETNNNLKKYRDFIHPIISKSADIISGNVSIAEMMYDNKFFNIEEFSDAQPGATEKNNFLIHITYEYIEKLIKEKSHARIMIFGAHKLYCIQGIAEKFKNKPVEICVCDSSVYFLDNASRRLKEYNSLDFRRYSDDEIVLTNREGKYDAIIAFDSLHRQKNIERTLKNLEKILYRNGLLAFSEMTKNSLLQLVSVAILEEGYTNFSDGRQESGKILLSEEEWREYLLKTGFQSSYYFYPLESVKSQAVFVAFGEEKYFEVKEEDMNFYIRKCVPEYMVPQMTFCIDEIPYTSNGKINRKHLLSIISGRAQDYEKTLPKKLLEQKLAKIWCEVLKQDSIFMEDDFFLLGGDSLLATKIKILVEKEFGVEVPLEIIFQHSLFLEYASKIIEIVSEGKEIAHLPRVEYDLEKRFEPFPLTDVQQSYWIGRNGGYDLGNVSSHCYFEMEGNQQLDINQLEDSWNELIKKHDMMRAIVLPDGSGQKVLKDVPRYRILTNFCKSENVKEQELYFRHIRNQMASKTYDSSCWPLFELRVTYYDNNRFRMHMSFDNIIFDGFSIFYLLEQWNKLYCGETVRYCEKLTFRDYVLTLEKMKSTDKYKEDLNYWKERVKTLPAAPQLPIIAERKNTDFTRFEFQLESKEWKKIAKIAESKHLTLSIVLMAAYAEVLGRYSLSKHFTLNLTRFQKAPIDSEVDYLVGDFTTLTLLEIDLYRGATFLERCLDIQNQLHQDMAHSLVSGVEVERELARWTGSSGISMPVVFTSGIGINFGKENSNSYFGNIIYGESQTPQVWMDHQLSIQNGKMYLSWDVVLGLFSEGLIQDMFCSYKNLVYKIMDEQSFVVKSTSLVDVKSVEMLEKSNFTSKKFENTDLVQCIKKTVDKFPKRIAIKTMEQMLTYKELDEITDHMAAELKANAVEKKPVAIMMEKGIKQVISSIAILKAGAIYLPIDIHNPQERIRTILEQSCTKYAIVDSCQEEKRTYIGGIHRFEYDDLILSKKPYKEPKIEPNDVAYIIFTSGSTGTPKGVMISHKAVLNTIWDINERYHITEDDCTILLSNMNFDLSVYDIFGMFVAGGAVAIPNGKERREPNHWIDLIIKSNVTIWNSVPTFMQMLIEYESIRKHNLNMRIRLVLLSGDWIPVTLPTKIRQQFGVEKIIALGGATEASIWSNCFEIPKTIPDDWQSIPYGKPLTNQGFLIMNKMLERVPIGVPGELYIYGEGLAKGYLNAPEKTNESFLYCPFLNRRIYKTGDWGKYMPDGNIQFLGRKDSQIKRGGHRIELGEIEFNLKRINGVKDAVVTFIVGDDSSLTANIIANQDAENKILLVEYQDSSLELFEHPRLSTQEIEAFTFKANIIEEISKLQIYLDMEQAGIIEYLWEPHTFDEIMAYFGIKKEYYTLMKYYLTIMEDYNLITVKDNVYKSCEDCCQKIRLKEEQVFKAGTELKQMLASSQKIRWNVIIGRKDPRELLFHKEKNFLYPEVLKKFDFSGDIMEYHLQQIVKRWTNMHKGNVLEIASRMENHTKMLYDITHLSGKYIYADESFTYLENKRNELGKTDIDFKLLTTMDSDDEMALHSISLIIAENTLHRFNDLHKLFEYLKSLLVPGGLILIVENMKNSSLIFETVVFLEEGYRNLEDERADTHMPLINRREWENLAFLHGFEMCEFLFNEEEENALGKNIMLMRGPKKIEQLNVEVLKKELKKYVPEYMVPDNYILYKEFPLTINGKIDRERMKELTNKTIKEYEKIIEPATEIEKQIANIWKELFKCKEVGRNSSFFELGGDSLQAIRFINQVKKELGYDISLQTITNHPVLKDLGDSILNNLSDDTSDDDGVWEEIEEFL